MTEMDPVPHLEFTEVNYNRAPYKNHKNRLIKFSWDMQCPHGDNIERFFFLFPELAGHCFPIGCYWITGAEIATECIIENYTKALREYTADRIIFALVECSCSYSV